MRLARGRHRAPDEGCCLVEFASVLAGERHSDHPRCVHPVLAAIARRINDECTDAGRARLVRLATPLIGTADAPEPISAVLVGICVRAALRHRVPAATRRRLCAGARQSRNWWYRRLVAPSVAAEGVTVLARHAVHADDELVTLLANVVSACRDVTEGTFSHGSLDITATEDHHVCTPYGMQSTEIEHALSGLGERRRHRVRRPERVRS